MRIYLFLIILLAGCSGLTPIPNSAEVPQADIPYTTRSMLVSQLIKKMQAKQYDVKSLDDDAVVFRKEGSLQTNTLYSSNRFTATELRVTCLTKEKRGGVEVRCESAEITNPGSVSETFAKRNDWYVVQQLKEILESIKKANEQEKK